MAKDVSAVESKSDDKKQKKREKNAVPTKLIIRRLPPYLTEDELIQTIGPLPPHDYFRYVKGDASLAPDHFCRAYINITSPDDIIAFRDKVDGLELTDSKGVSQMCILEYAPFQKNPRKAKKREDTKLGTIEEDADYKAFVESLQEEEEKIVIDLEKYLEELEKKEQKHKCVETPLTAFLKQKREERKRVRDERRKVEQERRKKRDEERRRREVERKKKMDAEKSKKKKEDDKKGSKRDDSKKESKEDQNEEKASSSDRKAEAQGKGDARLLNKGKFETSERPKSGSKSGDTRGKKLEGREGVRKGPIGSKPKDTPDGEERSKSGYNDRERGGYDKEPRGGYRGGYAGGRGSRGRGYRPTSSREFTSRKWDHKGDDVPPRARGKSWSEEADKRSEKSKKRPDREIYRPGSGRGGSRSSEGQSGGRPHKYSEQRSKVKGEEEK